MTAPFSVRLPERVKAALEAVRSKRSAQLGRLVPMSEVVHGLLEHPPKIGNMMLEFAALDTDRTKSLETIRLLVALNESLSPARAMFVAQLVHEASARLLSINPQNTAWAPVVKAFEALIGLPVTPAHQPYYLSHLGFHDPSNRDLENVPFHAAANELLKRYEHILETADRELSVEGLARCLAVALRDEAFDERAMNEALKPYWPDLLKLAIRGHVATTGKPLKILYDGMPVTTIARIRDNDLRVDITCGSENNISGYVGFGQNSLLTVGSFGDLLLLANVLESRTENPNRAYGAFEIKDDRVCLRAGNSHHYMTRQTAMALSRHLQSALHAPEHRTLFAAMRSAYGE